MGRGGCDAARVGAPGRRARRRRARRAGQGGDVDRGRQGRRRRGDRPASKAWSTLENGELSEVYSPTSGRRACVTCSSSSPTARRSPSGRPTRRARPAGRPRSLVYRQVNTEKSRRWRITKTYVTDPARAAVIVNVRLESLTGQPYRLYALCQPGAVEHRRRRHGTQRRDALVASDAKPARPARLAPRSTRPPAATWATATAGRTCSPTTDGRHYDAPKPGNIVQTGQTALTGVGAPPADAGPRLRRTTRTALARPRTSLRSGFAASPRVRARVARVPRLRCRGHAAYAAEERSDLRVSQMVLAALEDKTYRGAFIASPTMPWAWGNNDLGTLRRRTTWRGRVTFTRRPTGCSRPVTARRPGARSTTSGPPAAARRVLPAEQQPRRGAALAEPAARRGRRPDHPRRAARSHDAGTWRHVKRAAGLHRHQGAEDLAGALGEARAATRPRPSPRRSPVWCAPPTSRARTGSGDGHALPRDGRRMAAKVKGWTVTTNGPFSAQPVLPAPHQGR